MDISKTQITAQEAVLKEKVEALKHQIKDPKKLKEASEDFEALFIYFMLRNMRKSILKSGFIGDGFGGEMMQGLFDQEISRKIARHGQFGIAELILQQFASKQEVEVPNSFHLKELPLRPIKTQRRKLASYQLPDFSNKLKPFERHIQEASRKTGVSSDLIKAVIMAESSGNPNAVSQKNAKGLMQLMDSTATEVGVKDPFNPVENIHGGAKYLSKLLRKFQGNLRHALAAYNAGPSVVEKYHGVPPFKETQQYVNKVLAFYNHFRKKDNSL